MRALIVLIILSSFSFALRANESTEGGAEEAAGTQSTAAESAGTESSDDGQPSAPVEVRNPNDSFLPTDQLRHDQEVDYPTDI